ncbi:hypothetical protein LCGC14_1145100 [marine sediment metagenome]|uniref:Uncharacterized protein n=1 Tax=marine sediment metagenome TaxID=412755 RepID=A0A0F9LX30_9ZZZZ
MNTTQRTQVIIEKYRGNKDEYKMLKGILCMNHGWDTEDDMKLCELVDLDMIVSRLNELNTVSLIKDRL